MRKLCLRREIISDEMKNGSRMCVTLSAGEEPSSAIVKLWQTEDSRTHNISTSTKPCYHHSTMQNTVYETDEKDVKDKRKDVKDKKRKDVKDKKRKDVKDKKRKDVKDKKEKKLHTTPNSTLVQFGAAPQDGARIGRQLQISATLGIIYICTLS